MRRSWSVSASLMLVVVSTTACLISPIEEMATLRLAVEAPGEGAGSPPGDAWDKQGRFLLDTFGKFVRVALRRSGERFEEASLAWPAAGGGEDVDGVVALDLAVPPGAYRVELLGYVIENGRVFAYQETEAPPLRLIAGKTTETELMTRLHPSGAFAVQLACRSSDVLPFISAQLSLVDVRAHVVFPPLRLEGSPPFFSPLEIEGVPIGRPFATRVILTNEIDASVRVLEIVQPLLTIAKVGDRQVVLLKIPCF